MAAGASLRMSSGGRIGPKVIVVSSGEYPSIRARMWYVPSLTSPSENWPEAFANRPELSGPIIVP
jgi:hypothetical protein